MERCDIERNAEITMMRKDGATFKEIAEWYGVSAQRAQQICSRFQRYGETKEEIVRSWEQEQEQKQEQKQEEKKKKDEEMTAWIAWIRKREGGREYAIRNGAAEMFLTEISGSGGEMVYKYGSKEIRDALMFTREEATRIAKARKAVVCWVP